MNNKDIEEMKKLVLMVLEENRILREMLAKEWEQGRMSCSHDFEQRRKVNREPAVNSRLFILYYL